MMFDHGADALSSVFISLQVLQCLHISNGATSIFCLFLITNVVFFCAMWAQYATGIFRLGVINPVDEGLPSYALFALICILLPDNFWTQLTPLGPLNSVLMGILFILWVPLVIFLTRNIFSDNIRSKGDIINCLVLPISFLATQMLIYDIKP